MARGSETVAVGGLDLDGFLGHKTMGGGGGFLQNWKKDGSGQIVVAIHRTAPIYPLWAHGWHECVETEDKDGDKQIQVFNRRVVCHERELILRKQRFREPMPRGYCKATPEGCPEVYREKGGPREYPPELCPADLLVEGVFQMVVRGELSWVDPIFQFEGDDPEFNATVYAGGLCGMFQSRELTKKEIKQLKNLGIRRDEAFRQNMLCRCQYVLSIVDVSDPSAGVQTTLEATSLADKLKACIRHEVKRRREKGNPALNPYAFEWTYDDSQEFEARYDVCAMDTKLSEAVLRLLGTGDAEADRKSGSIPDLAEFVTPSNCLTFRSQVEAHLVDGVELPLDDFFAEAEKRGLMKAPASAPKSRKRGRAAEKDEEEDEREDDDEEEDDEEEEKDAPKPKASKPEPKAAAKPEKPLTQKERMVDCDHCGKEMSASEVICPHCGSTYDDKTGACDGRPCLTDGCKTRGEPSIVEVDAKVPPPSRHICAACGKVHELYLPEGADPAKVAPSWRRAPEEPKAAEAAGRRRRSASAEAEPPAEEEKPAKAGKAAKASTKRASAVAATPGKA